MDYYLAMTFAAQQGMDVDEFLKKMRGGSSGAAAGQPAAQPAPQGQANNQSDLSDVDRYFPSNPNSTLSERDTEALKWARANPDHPKSRWILELLNQQ